MTRRVWSVFVLLVVLGAGTVEAQWWRWGRPRQPLIVYVRAGASGAASGVNWTHALTAMPSSFVRGTTYYIADGDYGSLTVATAVNSTTKIIFKKATAGDHGTDTGWTASYGDGTSAFDVITYQDTKYIDTYRVTAVAIEVNAGTANNPNRVAFINLYDVTSKTIYILGEDILVSGGQFGGYNVCEGVYSEDPMRIWNNGYAPVSYPTSSSRVMIDGVTVGNVSDNGDECTGTARAGVHSDCMQIFAGHDITVRNSLFYNCATADILAQAVRDTLDNLVIENNFFGDVTNPGLAINFGGGSGVIGGTNSFRHNTISGFAQFAFPNGGNVLVRGNILGVGSCGQGVYDYNLFVGGTTCGTNTRTGTPAYVSDPLPVYGGPIPDYHLLVGDTAARDRGNTANYPATDYDGESRYVGSAPDLGADEYVTPGFLERSRSTRP